MGAPSHAEIALRAYQLWLEQGRPPHSADRNWLEAEHELQVAAKSHSLIAKVHEQAAPCRIDTMRVCGLSCDW
jgi:hypothetical protein